MAEVGRDRPVARAGVVSMAWERRDRYLWWLTVPALGAVLGAAAAAARAAFGVATRRWLSISIAWTSRWRRAAIFVVIVLLVLLEIRQQGRAELLMEGTSTFG